MCESILKENWEEIGRVLLLNAKSPYVKLSMLKTIQKQPQEDAIFDVRLFLCPSAVNETASGFRWVLFPAFGQHKEVMLLKHKCPSPRIGKKPRGNIGRWLYAAFLTATLSASLCQPASAATVWEKANEIMRDVYTQILGISTIAAIVTAAVALLMMNFSRSGRTVDESRAWLKRIIITWAVLNGLGFIMSYVTPFFSGGQWTAP